MTLKKIKIINVILLFAISFLFHFIYDWFPNIITSIFFPVNESIWEHMKIIFYAFLVITLIEMLICKIKNIRINNIYMEIATKSIGGIILYLLIFIPLYKLIGENMLVSISLMLLVYIIMEIVGYKILKMEELNIKILPIILLIITIVSFIVLTYYPPKNFLFIDAKEKEYGIIK